VHKCVTMAPLSFTGTLVFSICLTSMMVSSRLRELLVIEPLVQRWYRKKILELGPDPLREDADKELLWASMQVFTLKTTTLDRNLRFLRL
jgi:hypothetical protein